MPCQPSQRTKYPRITTSLLRLSRLEGKKCFAKMTTWSYTIGRTLRARHPSHRKVPSQSCRPLLRSLNQTGRSAVAHDVQADGAMDARALTHQSEHGSTASKQACRLGASGPQHISRSSVVPTILLHVTLKWRSSASISSTSSPVRSEARSSKRDRRRNCESSESDLTGRLN